MTEADNDLYLKLPQKHRGLRQSIRGRKTLLVLLLGGLALIFMVLPVAQVKIDPELAAAVSLSEQPDTGVLRHNIGLYNASIRFTGLKNSFGADAVTADGVDPAAPADEIERAVLAVVRARGDYDTAILLGYLAVLCAAIGCMAVYVRPNGIAGKLLLALPPLLFGGSGFLVRRGTGQITQNLSDIGYFFGFGASGSAYSLTLTPVFFLAIAASLLLFTANLAIKSDRQTRNGSENLMKSIIFACTVIAILSVGFITLFLFAKGIPTIVEIGPSDFLFGTEWLPTDANPRFGILNMICASVVGTLGAALIGVPMGLLVAVCIAKLAPAPLARVIRPAVDLLAGIPSVIYGAVGAIVLVPFVQKLFGLPTGATLFSAILVLSVMVLPTIISVAETSIRAVPETYMDASLALGVTKEATVFLVLIPAARSGIAASVLLGLGRAIGEAMAIILVAGNVPQLPELLKPVRFLTTGIVAEMGYATGLHRDALFAIGLVLFVFILVINSVFHAMMKKAWKQ